MPDSDASRPGVFLRTFQAFRYRDYRLMWTGACTSAVGTWMQTTAQSWLVLTLTNSPFYLGLIGFLAQMPIVLLSLLGGAAADRVDRRKLLLFSTYTQMFSAFILTLLVFAGVVQLWHFLVLVTVVGTAQAFGAPAFAALMPGLVKRRDMANAVALNSIQFNLALVIGPVLAGLIMTSYGAVACFGLNSLSFVAVICSLYLVKSSWLPVARKETVWEGIRNGLRFVRVRKSLWQLSLLGFVLTFSALPMTMLLPVYARDIYGLGPEGYAGMMTCSGVGAVVGGPDLGQPGMDEPPRPVQHPGPGRPGPAAGPVRRLHEPLHRAVAPLPVPGLPDGAVCLRHVAGPGRHHRRDARTGGEHLQPGHEGGHAAGQPGGRIPGLPHFRALCPAGGQRTNGRRCPLLPLPPGPGHPAVVPRESR